MNLAVEARRLADYIQYLNLPSEDAPNTQHAYTHIGALYTNIVLQAGLNYRTVVQPRVMYVLSNFPEGETVTGFLEVIEKRSIEVVMKWEHPEKVLRMQNILKFSMERSINTCNDLAKFLSDESNHESFLSIKGVGNKTLDYTMKLLNFDTVAVDRHIYSFIELAGLPVSNYRTTKKMVEFAADLLEVSRSAMDYRIWHYMSNKNNQQIPIHF